MDHRIPRGVTTQAGDVECFSEVIVEVEAEFRKEFHQYRKPLCMYRPAPPRFGFGPPRAIRGPATLPSTTSRCSLAARGAAGTRQRAGRACRAATTVRSRSTPPCPTRAAPSIAPSTTASAAGPTLSCIGHPRRGALPVLAPIQAVEERTCICGRNIL